MGLLAEAYRTGALNQPVKDEPLPPGYYWIDIFDSDERPASIATFNDWVQLHADTVVVRRTEDYEVTGEGWVPPFWNPDIQYPWTNTTKGEWVLFEVLAPTTWMLEIQLGWPNEGQANMTSQDTIQRPDPPKGPFDEGYEWPAWAPWAIGGGIVLLGGLLILAVKR